jgi:TATA-binding protein-associated factor Taf7
LELQAQENALKNELVGLRSNLESNRSKAQTTANPVMKGRFERAAAKAAEQVTEKEQCLAAVQGEMQGILAG